MEKEVSTQAFTEIPMVTVPDIGLGTCRAAGTYIVMLLQLEEPARRAGIIVHAAKKLGIPLDELTGEYTDSMCPKCGVSMYSHIKNGGCY